MKILFTRHSFCAQKLHPNIRDYMSPDEQQWAEYPWSGMLWTLGTSFLVSKPSLLEPGRGPTRKDLKCCSCKGTWVDPTRYFLGQQSEEEDPSQGSHPTSGPQTPVFLEKVAGDLLKSIQPQNR